MITFLIWGGALFVSAYIWSWIDGDCKEDNEDKDLWDYRKEVK